MKKEVSIKVNARHVGQLGRELVTDYVTALTELVKNSYDADGDMVEVKFLNMNSGNGKIIIADTGCGFSIDDIENNWAVIGTSSKVKKPYSEKYKRRCVGKKGIGRYSVERLAEYCTLYSFKKDCLPIKYYMNWNKYEGIDFSELKQRVEILYENSDFESAKYIKRAIEYLLFSRQVDHNSKDIIKNKILQNEELNFVMFYNKDMLKKIEIYLYPIYEKYNGIEERVEDVKNIVEELEGDEKNIYYNKLQELYEKNNGNRQENCTGTLLVLDNLRDNWTKNDIEKVIKEFRILVSPLEEKNNFSIYITAPEYDLYEIKLQNNILRQKYAKVEAELKVRSKDARNEKTIFYARYTDREGTDKNIQEELSDIYICGSFKITIYYFLRDKSLKFDGLKAAEAKNILDAFCGVKIYRDGFRVRPYGEEGNDWLLLDRTKIKDPHSYRVGNNQVIGVVNINSDENPLLIDSTNREAIIENEAFGQLKKIVSRCINIIEQHRYNKYLEERKETKIVEEAEKRKREQEDLKKELITKQKLFSTQIKKGSVELAEKVVLEMLKTVSQDQKKEKRHYENTKKEYEKKLKDSNNELQLYKNLAVLGILAGSFGHETDDSIARVLLNIVYPRERFLMEFPDDEDIKEAFEDLDNDIQRISCYSDLLMAFLKKNKRTQTKNLSFKRVIEDIVKYYRILVDEYSIIIDIKDLQEFNCKISMKQIDLESIIVNLLTNSFEALKGIARKRIIKISTIECDEEYNIIFEDSGDGVREDLKEWIFMPLNTTKKEDGVGLGLTIVRDVVESYYGEIKVEDSEEFGGAKFIVSFPMLEEVKNE